MNKDIVTNLIAEKDSLQQQIEISQRRLKIIDALLSDYEAERQLELHRSTSSAIPTQAELPRAERKLTPREVGRIAREILLESRAPMTRGKILRQFEERGHRITGGDRAKVLGTILWRLKKSDGSPEFRNTPNGYWPADVELKADE